MLTYKVRPTTRLLLLHASHTPPSKSNLQAFLAANGRELGLLEIGYHFLILRDGKLVECRPHNMQGSHCRGADRHSIGVCLAGGLSEDIDPEVGTQVPEDNFTPAQGETLRGLRAYLKQFYGDLPLMGHSEITHRHPRCCPPTDMEKVRQWTAGTS